MCSNIFTSYEQLTERDITSLREGCGLKDVYQESYDKLEDTSDDDKMNKGVKNLVLLISDKNETGKTTLSCNISILLAKEGFKVGIIEFDITNLLTKSYEMIPDKYILRASWEWNPLNDSERHIKILSIISCEVDGNEKIQKKTSLTKSILNDSALKDLDIILCDINSGSIEQNERALSLMKRLSPEGVLILTDPYAKNIQMIESCKKIDLKIIGIIENMANIICPSCNSIPNLFRPHRIRSIAKQRKVPYFGIQFNEILKQTVELGFCTKKIDRKIIEQYYQNNISILEKIKNTLNIGS